MGMHMEIQMWASLVPCPAHVHVWLANEGGKGELHRVLSTWSQVLRERCGEAAALCLLHPKLGLAKPRRKQSPMSWWLSPFALFPKLLGTGISSFPILPLQETFFQLRTQTWLDFGMTAPQAVNSWKERNRI